MKVSSLLEGYFDKEPEEVVEQWKDALRSLDVPTNRTEVNFDSKEQVDDTLTNIRWLKRHIMVRNGVERPVDHENITPELAKTYRTKKKQLTKFLKLNKELEGILIRLFQKFKRQSKRKDKNV